MGLECSVMWVCPLTMGPGAPFSPEEPDSPCRKRGNKIGICMEEGERQGSASTQKKGERANVKKEEES